MVINLANEAILTLREATRFLPRAPNGGRIHISTLYRWATRGVGGARLDTLKLGGRLVTSREALQRFAERCSESDKAALPAIGRRRERAIKTAETELDRAGI